MSGNPFLTPYYSTQKVVFPASDGRLCKEQEVLSMRIIRDIEEMQQAAAGLRQDGKRIGFVPTMGYLHEGHLSLMRIARAQCDVLIVSIFVNPAQFGPAEDLDKYPRDFERDKASCRKEEADIIFYPRAGDMYPDGYQTYIQVEKLSATMCGASRPGHFRGVTTVVGKLFHIVKPHFAVFGQKDYQQMQIIRQMVRDLNMEVEILGGPIVREAEGLAMSSRNKYLSPEERADALALYESLQLARRLFEKGIKQAGELKLQMEMNIRKKRHARIDYIAVVDARTLAPVNEIVQETLIALAVYVGETRLIDNIIIHPGQEG